MVWCTDIGSLQFYTTFWTLTMYDLQVPSTAYDRQIQLHKSQAPMEDEKDAVGNAFISMIVILKWGKQPVKNLVLGVSGALC